ncbi:MAG: ATP-binding protein [Clostridia bacterium]|nr:ATP-binding protein [Clostridia bacterium]
MISTERNDITMQMPYEIFKEYQNTRDSMALLAKKRRKEVDRICPEAIRCDTKIKLMLLNACKDMLRFDENATPQSAVERMTAMEAEKRDILVKNGFPEDYLDPIYLCSACKDTGEVNGVPCACFKRKLVDYKYKNSYINPAKTFASFRDDIYPTPENRALMLKFKDYCLDYCERFPNGSKNNLMIRGRVGIGKSFMLDCIANRVRERGFSVVKVTAFSMIDSILAAISARSAQQGGVEVPRYTEPELLLIDDLGNEPEIRNVTNEYLLEIVDKRLELGLATIYSTNLEPSDMLKVYGERITSRIMARNTTEIISLRGEDLRLLGRF